MAPKTSDPSATRTERRQDLSEAGPGRDVDLGTLGAGRVLLRSTGPTLVAHPGGEAFVHVAGTLSPGELQAIAAGLRRS